MDAYRRLQAIKQKKRTPTKKEKEMAIRALKERESLVKALENMS
jgi:transcriptional adapter 3